MQSYLIIGSQKAALIDTGMGFVPIRPVIEKITPLPVIVLNTHWHFDHIGGNIEFDTAGISNIESELASKSIGNQTLTAVYVQPCINQGVPMPERFKPEKYRIRGVTPQFEIHDGDRFDLGGRVLEAVATPGHTKGSMSFLDSHTDTLICGDLLYPGTLYAHFTDSDLHEYIQSLARLNQMKKWFSRLLGAHNEPQIHPEFITHVLSVMRQIKSGKAQKIVITEWGKPVDLFQTSGISVLVKQVGSAGVALF